MHLRSLDLFRLGVVMALLFLLLVPPVLAQGDDEDENARYAEPGINYRNMKTKKSYVDWAFGMLIVTACLIPAFKNPHRSHLD